MLGFEVCLIASRSLEGLLKFGNLDRMIFEGGNDVNNTAVLRHVYRNFSSRPGKRTKAVEGSVKIEEQGREKMKKRWVVSRRRTITEVTIF